VATSVLWFAVAGLVVTLSLGGLTSVLARRAGTEEASRSFAHVALVVASGLAPSLPAPARPVDPRENAMLAREAHALTRAGPVVRIKVWDATGRILWSDEPRLIGQTAPLSPEVRTALHTGRALVLDLSDTAAPEHRYERGMGPLLEAYAGVRSPDGSALLVEVYETRDEVTAATRQSWLAFGPEALGALLLLQLVQLPLVRRLDTRSQKAEAAMLTAAVQASGVERRRIAGDVHDNVVPLLNALAYGLDSARLGTRDRPAETEALLTRTAAGVRRSVAELRALLVDLVPARLPAGGLGPALEPLVKNLERNGTRVTVRMDGAQDLSGPTATLLFLCAQEALRNVSAHSRAQQVALSVERDDEGATMVIDDDGCGFDQRTLAESTAAGHLGLRALGGRLADAGGSLTAFSVPGRGTRLVATLPLEEAPADGGAT
jgi:signal transduction histidine kinase